MLHSAKCTSKNVKFSVYGGHTSPSGEKLRAEIKVVNVASEPPARRLGIPGGPLASKTLIFVTLHFQYANKLFL